MMITQNMTIIYVINQKKKITLVWPGGYVKCYMLPG